AGAGSLLRAVDGHQRHDRLPDREPLSGLHRELGGSLTVEEGPVRAAEVLDADVAVFEVDLGVTSRGLRITKDDVPGFASDGCHPCTDVAGLGGLVDVLDLENVVGRHSRPPLLGGESPNCRQATQGSFPGFRWGPVCGHQGADAAAFRSRSSRTNSPSDSTLIHKIKLLSTTVRLTSSHCSAAVNSIRCSPSENMVTAITNSIGITSGSTGRRRCQKYSAITSSVSEAIIWLLAPNTGHNAQAASLPPSSLTVASMIAGSVAIIVAT